MFFKTVAAAGTLTNLGTVGSASPPALDDHQAGERCRAAESATVVDETRDATRRTRLANERTYLAWWRTGLTTLAVSIAAGKLVPELSSGANWPYVAIGVAFAAVGLLFIGYAYVRQKRVEDALARGEYAPFDPRAAFAFAALGVILGIATIAVVVTQPA
jgi:putative membrane protein